MAEAGADENMLLSPGTMRSSHRMIAALASKAGGLIPLTWGNRREHEPVLKRYERICFEQWSRAC